MKTVVQEVGETRNQRGVTSPLSLSRGPSVTFETLPSLMTPASANRVGVDFESAAYTNNNDNNGEADLTHGPAFQGEGRGGGSAPSKRGGRSPLWRAR